MSKGKIIVYIKENRWIILAAVFFVLWKFFLIGILWQDRSIPPEPDDSYEYIGNIAAVSGCSDGIFCSYTGVSMADHSGFTYLTYRLIFGIAGKIIGLSPEQSFHLAFYVGTVLLILVLVPFLRVFTNDARLQSFIIIFLAAYHGTGESHGFFWVVPSFFSILFLLLIYRLLFAVTKNLVFYPAAGMLSILFTFTHPISVYFSLFFPLYVGIFFFLSKTFNPLFLKRTLFVTIVILASSLLQSQYLNHLSQINYYGIENTLMETSRIVHELSDGGQTASVINYSITDSFEPDLLSDRIATLNAVYFRYIIPHWSAIILLIFVLLVLYLKRNFKLLSFYLAALLFFIGSTFLHPFGFRSAILLWPITYICYSFAVWYTILFFWNQKNPLFRRTGLIVSIGLVLAFLFINAIFSITFNSNLAIRKNYLLNQGFSAYMEMLMGPDDHVGMGGILARTEGGSRLYLSGKTTNISKRPEFLALIEERARPEVEHAQVSVISRITSATTKILGLPQHSSSTETKNFVILEGYQFISAFGDIKIYKRY